MNDARARNNFDLLRIAAAMQVAIVHVCSHFDLQGGLALELLEAVPGVPIFFVISGYLVSASFKRTSLARYAFNRALRIFPALWICLALSMIAAAIWGHVDFARADVLPWLIAQLSIAQFYNPGFLRNFGVGVLNGSLWTIPVELQFYAALPVIWWLANRRPVGTLVILTLLGAAAAVCIGTLHTDALWYKLLGVTLAPYLFMFLLGVLLEHAVAFRRVAIVGKALIWVLLFSAAEILVRVAGLKSPYLILDPLSAAILACAVVAIAFARPIDLHGFDMSYGIYIYHMPVLNVFVAMGRTTAIDAALAIGVSIGLASLSWVFIERPALSLKRRARSGASVPARPASG